MKKEYVFSDKEIFKISMLYKSGLTYIDISKILNLPKHAIERYLHVSGLTKLKKVDKLTKEVTDTIVTLHLNGKSVTNISTELKYTKNLITQVLKKEGVYRGYKESMIAYSKQNKLNSDFFNVIDTEQKAYWLGFIYADGNINKDLTMLSIGLKIDDIEHLKLLGDIFHTEVKIYKQKAYKTMPDRLTASLRVTNRYLCLQLVSKGILPRKSYIDNIEVFKYVPDNLIRHFIRGFFDGDGCISNTRWKALTFCNNSVSFLSTIALILERSLGITGTLMSKSSYSRLTYGSKCKLSEIKDFLYKDSTIFLERKYCIFS